VRRFNTLEKLVITILAAVAWGGATFAISCVLLGICVEVFDQHPGSMAGFWIFMNSLFPGAAGCVAGVAWAVIRVWPVDRAQV